MRWLLPLLALVACNHAKPPAALPASGPASAAAPADDVAALVKLAASGPTIARYPQADAYLSLDEDDITLAADGTQTEHHHSIVRILDAQRGRARFADVRIPYDTKRQTFQIDIARTVNADGSVQEAKGDEISEILPPEIQQATMYSSVLEKVVSFPGVDTGSVVELAWTRVTRPDPDAPLGGDTLLADWDPIGKRVVKLTVPDGTPPKIDTGDASVHPVESEAGGMHTWTWTLQDVPGRQHEPYAPPDEAVFPRLVYSVVGDWKTVAARVSDRFLQKAAPKDLPAAVKTEADALVASAKATDDEAKAVALYRFVSRDIRSVDLPLGWAGYAPNAPDVVLANRYGDDRDKVGLFLALCAAEGISAQPVLVRDQGVPVVASVPSIAQFDRMIARIGDVWLDPSDEDGRYGAGFAGQGTLALTLTPGGGSISPRPLLDPAASTSKITTNVALDPNGDLHAAYTFDETGLYADYTSGGLRPYKGDNLDHYFQRQASGLAPGAIDAGHQVGDLAAVTGPIRVSQQVTAPAWAPAQGDWRVVELPSPTLWFTVLAPGVGLSARKLPLWLGTPRTVDESVTVAVPKGWKVAGAPPDLAGSGKGLTWNATCKAEGARVVCHRVVTYDALQVAPADYAAFHDALVRLNGYRQRVVLLTR